MAEEMKETDSTIGQNVDKIPAEKVIENFANNIETSQLHIRLTTLNDLSSTLCLSQCDPLTRPETRWLVSVLGGVLLHPTYLEPTFRYHVERLIAKLLAAVPSTQTFPLLTQVAAVYLSSEAPTLKSPHQQAAAMRLACLLLIEAGRTGQLEGNPEWSFKVIVTICGLLDSLLREKRSQKYRKMAIHQITAVWRVNPDLVPLCLETWVSNSDCKARAWQALQCLAICCLGVAGKITAVGALLPYAEDVKQRLLEFYVAEALTAKVKPDKESLDSLKSLLSSVTSDEYDALIHPVVEKALKKNPEAALPTVEALLGSLKFEISRHIPTAFLAPVLRQLRSSKEEVRTLALRLLGHLAKLCSDPGVYVQMAGEIGNVLAGKSGVLAQWYQRLGTVAGLRALRPGVAVLDHASIVQVAQAAAAALKPLLQKEAHEQTRLLAFTCLGEWISMLDEVPSDMITVLTKGISQSDAAKCTPSLLALSEICENPVLCAQLQPMLGDVLGIIKSCAAKKVQVHFHGLLAIKIALLVGATSNELAEIFPWGVLKKNDSFAFNSGLYSQQQVLAPDSPEVALSSKALGALCAAMAEAVCNHPDAALLSCDTTPEEERQSPAVCRALVNALLHSDGNVRAVAEEACCRMGKAEEVLTALWGTVRQFTQESEEHKKALQMTIPSKEEDSTSSFKLPNQAHIAAAIKTVLKASGKAKALWLPRLLLLTHHPLATQSHKAAEKLWSSIQDLGFGGFKDVQNMLEDHVVATEVSDELMQAMQSEFQTERAAGQRALATLAGDCGEVGFNLAKDGVVPGMLLQLQRPEILDLSEREVGIYYCPEGTLFSEVGKKEEIALNKNAERRRVKTGKRGNVYDAEDEEWELQFKKEQEEKKKKAAAKKGGKKGGNSKAAVDDEEAKVLQEESEIRKRVGAARLTAVALLESIGWVFAANMYLGQLTITEALPVLLKLLEMPLLKEEAHLCLRQLASALDPCVSEWGLQSSGALRLVYLNRDPQLVKVAAESKVVYKVLNHVAKQVIPLYTSPVPLAPATFHFVFPVLKASLLSPPTTAAAQQALGIISAHASMPEDESEGAIPCHSLDRNTALRSLRKEMIATVLHALKTLPKIEPNPAKVLTTLCTGPTLTPGEWSPLFGDAGLLCKDDSVRISCLDTIMTYAMEGGKLHGNPLVESRLWLARHDDNEEVVELAEDIWEARGEDLSPMYSPLLLALIGHNEFHVRKAAGKALAGAVLEHPNSLNQLKERLFGLFVKNKPEEKNKEEEKMENLFALGPGDEDESKENKGKWQPRSGVALTIKALGELNALDDSGEYLDAFLQFLVKEGICDIDDVVRKEMTEAGIALVSAYGPTQCETMLALFDETLSGGHQTNESVQVFDFRREGAVVFMGRCAKFLDPSDPKVETIVATLMEALSTPSEAVQSAVSDCLAPLMKIPAIKANGSQYLEQLMQTVIRGERYGDRRGAAFGVAAVVKGVGISALKKEGIISKCEEACQKGPYTGKQGALFTFECLCLRLGMLFEPYIIAILPLLLKCFSDSSDHVREAAYFTARAIMANLSQHGVKLVLPAILKSLSDKQWRTKHAAILLLGSMGSCAPRQLGQCLPQIVPKLIESFADTHPKVKEAGKKALGDIGKVISNPEVSRLSPVLLGALSDPSNKTKDALQSMLQCEFLHAIDAPSLALLVPVMRRGLKDRSAEAKKKAALITGNMCQMVADAKDLLPYLDQILPNLKEVLVDPVPDVRATSAKAMGSMVKGIGEDKLEDLVPWLIMTLKSEESPVERSGGAQGLAEILAVLGLERTEDVLDELLPLYKHPEYAVREGLLWLLSFLPATLGTDYCGIIPQAMPVILSGLADETESVRSVAMTAGQVLVNTNGKHHPQLLLPTLEEGLFDPNWRIRQSSVQLLGDLIFLLGGIRAGDLGDDQRHSILASLYVIRSDVSAVVRQSALQTWKDLVQNTPRTLREIMPTLINLIVTSLSADETDRRIVAGRALGDLVKKLGDTVLPEIVPFLRDGLEKGNETTRQGVCLGLSEILECANRRQIEDFIGTLVPAVQDALCDDSEDVREQAAAAFQTLHRVVGSRATEEVIPSLLKELRRESPGTQRAIYGLKEVLRLRARELLNYLIPKMMVHPMYPWQARVMSAVAESTPMQIHYYVQQIIPNYIQELSDLDVAEPGSEDLIRKDAVEDAFRSLVVSVDTVGVNFTVSELVKHVGSAESVLARKYGAWGLEQFLLGSQADFLPQVPVILRDLLQRMHETDDDVLKAVNATLKALNKAVKPDELVKHLEFSRTLLSSLISDKRWKGGVGEGEFLLRGTNIPKGLEPLLPMYQQGLMYGSPQIREVAAKGLGELVEVTSAAALKPFLIKITGPLIRIVGDRFPAGVKAAILQTLGLLLMKGGIMLRPFVPQLQTTFIKALSDPSDAVRKQGSKALANLMQIATRVDPLVSELLTGTTAGTPAIRVTMLQALQGVLLNFSSSPSAGVLSEAVEILTQILAEEDEGARAASASALGAVSKHLDEESLASLMQTVLVERGSVQADWLDHHGRTLALGSSLKALATQPNLSPFLDQIIHSLLGDATSDRLPIRVASCQGFVGLLYFAQHQGGVNGPAGMIIDSILPSLISLLADGSPEVRKPAVRVFKYASKLFPDAMRQQINIVVPPLLNVVKDPNLQTKLVSERALLHILEIHTRPETLNEFISKADADSARFVRDYSRRVLARLPADSSDDESEF